jgi:hypothetical protein
MDLEKMKQKFKDHKATFTDYGNIKILDFKKPNSTEYRIRFLFEEDYYRLHISGDLGQLTATNYCNMCWNGFKDFVDNVEYFKEKIDCLDRHIFLYDQEQAEKDIAQYIEENDLYFEIDDDYQQFKSKEEIIDDFLSDVLYDFSEETGIGSYGNEAFTDIDESVFEVINDFGKTSTGILDLYMLAFKLAKEQLDSK